MKDNIRSIISSSTDPGFNLAAEEVLLRKNDFNVHFFYINKPSVIIGKHQNALAEINLNYLETNNIPLYRRLSGGGTVYHDEGNLNFCFIKNGEINDLVNFKRSTEPIVTALNQWDIPVRHGVRNDLLIDYKKISGNACHVFKRRVMHHGTLLFKSNLDHLTNSLKSDPGKFKDKAVKSVRSQVMNISEVYDEKIDTPEFLAKLEEKIRRNNRNIELSNLSSEEINDINKLKSEKYDTTEWNYSYGPAYEFNKRLRINDFVFSVNMKVEKGRITHLDIKCSNNSSNIAALMIEQLTGKFHQKSDIVQGLIPIVTRYPQYNEQQLTELFF